MKCPFCEAKETEVLESRTVEDGVRRRRACGHCHKRFTTFEKVRGTALWIIKKDGKRELFDSDKVKRGILKAVEKRPVSLDLVDNMVNEVEKELLKKATEEIPSKVVGNEILRRLRKVDKVAWLRFASVYLEFEDLSDFEKAIDKLS